MIQKQYLGIFYLALSTVIFSAATVFVKIAATTYKVPPTQVSFARFLTGLVLTLAVITLGKHRIRPVKMPVLVIRGVFNSAAVILFFIAISRIGVTKANIFNLTYPVFVALFAPLFLKEKLTLPKLLSVALAFYGAYLVSGAGSVNFRLQPGDLIGMMSGLTAGFAIIALRKARLTETSLTILLFLMSIGTVINGLIFFNRFIMPDTTQLLLMLLVGVLTFMGQMAITYGYKYIDALPGAIISTSRIFIAAVLGIVFLGERITLPVILGGTLIFISVVGISYYQKYGPRKTGTA